MKITDVSPFTFTFTSDTLDIIQDGNTHHIIVPREGVELTREQFQDEVRRIKTSKTNSAAGGD